MDSSNFPLSRPPTLAPWPSCISRCVSFLLEGPMLKLEESFTIAMYVQRKVMFLRYMAVYAMDLIQVLQNQFVFCFCLLHYNVAGPVSGVDEGPSRVGLWAHKRPSNKLSCLLLASLVVLRISPLYIQCASSVSPSTGHRKAHIDSRSLKE